MTRLEIAQADAARLRQDVRKLRGRLAAVRDELAPLRLAHKGFLEALWERCWTAHRADGATTNHAPEGRAWREAGTFAGCTWQPLGASAWAEKDRVLAELAEGMRPHLDAETALKREVEIAERDLEAADRLVDRIKANSTEGRAQHVLDLL